MTDPATAWLVLALVLVILLGLVVVSCAMIADDLEDANHEEILDDLWGDDE